MAATLRVIIRSFERPLLPKEFFGNPSGVRLPETRVVYTVNRSPHIDKKSREQFDMRVKTRVLDIKASTPDDLRKKYFWLKRQRIFGAQYEVQIFSKTRLDKRLLEKMI